MTTSAKSGQLVTATQQKIQPVPYPAARGADGNEYRHRYTQETLARSMRRMRARKGAPKLDRLHEEETHNVPNRPASNKFAAALNSLQRSVPTAPRRLRNELNDSEHWKESLRSRRVSTGQDSGKLRRSQYGGTIRMRLPGTNEEFLLSDCQGRRKALFVGCLYSGTEMALHGCINDCHNMAEFIIDHYHFPEDNILMLTDDQADADCIPTAENIVSAMYWLVEDAEPGDSLFFHFSGHGVSIEDTDGDEVDGFDEAICPIDFENGVIVDDLIHEILVHPLKPGVRLTAVFDCCHSGTAMDLPYIYSSSGELQNDYESPKTDAVKAILEGAKSLSKGNTFYAFGQFKEGLKLLRRKAVNTEAIHKTIATRTSLADVVMFSGCRDDQTAADIRNAGEEGGALSRAIINTLKRKPGQTYIQLLRNLRQHMRGSFTQVPQMSTGHPMNMNVKFIM